MATRKDTAKMIAVMQAYVEEKEIQSSMAGSPLWYDDADPAWDWAHNDFRVKPEPREWWLVYTGCVHKAYPNLKRAQEDIEDCCGNTDVHKIIHVREVQDE